MSETDLQARVQAALASRDRSSGPPAFEHSWRAAVVASAARRPAAAPGFAWLEPAAAIAAIATIALAAAWQFAGSGAGPAPWTEAADLQLAREFAPDRQWPVATDVLLRSYEYGPPSDIVIPEIENPFEESFL